MGQSLQHGWKLGGVLCRWLITLQDVALNRRLNISVHFSKQVRIWDRLERTSREDTETKVIWDATDICADGDVEGDVVVTEEATHTSVVTYVAEYHFSISTRALWFSAVHDFIPTNERLYRIRLSDTPGS